jgi:hypothetical protein
MEKIMQVSFRKLAIVASTFACAAMLSFGWSEQAQAAYRHGGRLYVSPTYYYNPGQAGLGLPWYAVRAYYAGGPWCGVGSAAGYGYGTAGGWGGSWTCYSGWADYKQRNGIGCDPGSFVKGGDGILYVCQ